MTHDGSGDQPTDLPREATKTRDPSIKEIEKKFVNPQVVEGKKECACPINNLKTKSYFDLKAKPKTKPEELCDCPSDSSESWKNPNEKSESEDHCFCPITRRKSISEIETPYFIKRDQNLPSAFHGPPSMASGANVCDCREIDSDRERQFHMDKQKTISPRTEPEEPSLNLEPKVISPKAEPKARSPRVEPRIHSLQAEPMALTAEVDQCSCPIPGKELQDPSPRAEPKAPSPRAEPKAPSPRAEPKAPSPRAEPKAPSPRAEPK